MKGRVPDGVAPAQDAAPGNSKTILPGELYQRVDRWWWRVKLPGEDKVRTRPLRPAGVDAADGRETAERTAFEMWERAVEDNAARQIRMESTEKIERLKAQFLDKVRHFTELVETANAKLEAEARARAEAEEKLRRLSVVGTPLPAGNQPAALGQQPPVDHGQPVDDNAGQKTERGGEPAVQIAAQAQEAEKAAPPASNPQGPIPSPPASAAGPNSAAPGADLRPSVETGECECCGATGIAMTHLHRIDSGQTLCPRCLATLRADVTRIESDAFAEDSARGNK
jgi:hypothetical protein